MSTIVDLRKFRDRGPGVPTLVLVALQHDLFEDHTIQIDRILFVIREFEVIDAQFHLLLRLGGSRGKGGFE